MVCVPWVMNNFSLKSESLKKERRTLYFGLPHFVHPTSTWETAVPSDDKAADRGEGAQVADRVLSAKAQGQRQVWEGTSGDEGPERVRGGRRPTPGLGVSEGRPPRGRRWCTRYHPFANSCAHDWLASWSCLRSKRIAYSHAASSAGATRCGTCDRLYCV